ncbi:MAG: sugar transferase [Caldilineaceae bacterium]|nr:sugar transferase [Caldilineaceae bacterium]
MIKRLFDLIVSSILLMIALPVLLCTTLAIRIESLGPIWYRSPRLGRGGKQFGMFRFRTVDINRSDTLPMNERLTVVGRFIRTYSIDDLPNLCNVLSGDLSIVGPHPMEPEQVDRSDPVWQQILTIRPGLVSPAILQLGKTYNATPPARKAQLELEYVRRASFGYDLQICWYGIQRFVETKGNFKRGVPHIDNANIDSTDEDDR